MKKFFSLMVFVAMSVSMVGCGEKPKAPAAPATPATEPAKEPAKDAPAK